METKFSYMSAVNNAVSFLNGKVAEVDKLYQSRSSLQDIVHATNSVIIQAHELKRWLDLLVEDVDKKCAGYYRMTDV